MDLVSTNHGLFAKTEVPTVSCEAGSGADDKSEESVVALFPFHGMLWDRKPFALKFLIHNRLGTIIGK
jgi:hypothetical protein